MIAKMLKEKYLQYWQFQMFFHNVDFASWLEYCNWFCSEYLFDRN